jgi:hypothetical protein
VNLRSIPAFGSSAIVHVLAGTLLWMLCAAPSRTDQRRGRASVVPAFLVVPAEDSAFPGLNPLDAVKDSTPRRARRPSAVSIGTFTADIGDIVDHARLLFPFLTPGLSLKHFTAAPPRESRDRLGNPFVTASLVPREGAGNRPLVLTERALQSLVDRSWSRRDRWSTFQPIMKLAQTYDADTGKLPDLLQGYRDQNWLQPYADTTIHDPRLWTELGLAASHVSFIGFIRRYAAEHPATRATTELLFLLDKMAQASREALTDLLDTDPQEDLTRTRDANRNAYELVLELRYYYARELQRRGLTARQALTAYYDGVRLAILSGIVRTTPSGYRASDARFLIGAIYWQQRKSEDALRWWRQMVIDPTDSYVLAYSDIVRAIRRADAQRSAGDAQSDQALAHQINRILDAEHARWLMFSTDRLRRFGYRFDTF